ncbi:MAG: hypothetical protein K8I30_21240 [Anaerolineae bacterium]|nr:hypothetical protein [Anaerolineae bacterium]
MNEKVTHEIRVIETEDGFRIELKGDKEELRRLIFEGRWGKLRHFFHRHESEHHHEHQPPFAGKRKMRGGRHHGRYDLGVWWDDGTSGENA